nr:MAG TPA: tail completion protein [Caudoviricetes sp.]
MTLANFLSAIARKLTGIWPDRLVYTGEIPQNADEQFFVGIIESGQGKHLDRRRTRTIQFEVLYFLQSKDTMAFQSWAEAMYDNFDTLTVREDDEKTRVVHLTGQKAQPDDNACVYQFLFDVGFHAVLAPEEGPTMENLEQSEVYT